MLNHTICKFLLFLIICLMLPACSKNIEGKVTDVFGNGVAGVAIKIDKSNYTTTTDNTGKYSLEYAPGSFSVKYAKSGYTTMRVDLNLQQKTKFPAEEVVMYPIPKEQGVYYIGDKELIKLNFDKTVQQNSAQSGNYFSFTWNYQWFVGGQPGQTWTGWKKDRAAISKTGIYNEVEEGF